MRSISKGMLVLLCGYTTLFGMALAAEPTPRADLTEAQFESEPVVEGTAMVHAFTVRNTGDAPLIFGTIKSG